MQDKESETSQNCLPWVKTGCVRTTTGQERPHSIKFLAMLDCACLSTEWIPGTSEPGVEMPRAGGREQVIPYKEQGEATIKGACAKLLKA